MLCCGKKPDEEPEGEPKMEDVMDKHRRCTDILFLLLFVAFMIGLFAAGIFGFANGDPKILIFGTDYQGDLCDKGDNEGLQVRYWVNPFEIMSSIPSVNTAGNKYNFRDVKSICLDACPKAATTAGALNWVCNYPDSKDGYGYSSWTRDTWKLNNYDYYSQLNATLKRTSLEYKGPCYPVLLPTINNYQSCTYYGNISTTSNDQFESLATAEGVTSGEAYALSSIVSTLSKAVSDFLSAPVQIMERYIDDFAQGWAVCLVMGFVAPLLLSFAWLGILRYFTGIFAYFIVFIVNAAAVACTVFLYMKAGIIGTDSIDGAVGAEAEAALSGASGYTDPSEENQEVLKYCAYAATVVTVLFLGFSLLMLRRIAIAVAVIKVATQAIAGAPSVVFFPVAPVLCALGFGAYWVAAAVYLFSAGEIKQQECDIVDGYAPKKYCIDPTSAANCHCGYKSEMNENLQYMLLYHLFGLLWTTQFLQAMTYLILASVFATYYFRGGTYGDSVTGWINTPVIQSMRKMSWYHSGSAALGSLLVAIMQFIRILVAYAVNQLKSAGKENVLVKYAACCVQYCLWYLQKVIEWLNRNAYIMVAIEGKSFCWSAWEAVSLIFANILTVGAVNVVGDTLLFLGKLSISLVAGFLAFLMLDGEAYTTGENKVSSPLFIVLFVVVFSFVISGLFMSVVEMAIDTVLLSFCKDVKLHGGKPKFAPPLLEEVLGKAEEEGKAKANAALEKKKAKAEADLAALGDNQA